MAYVRKKKSGDGDDGDPADEDDVPVKDMNDAKDAEKPTKDVMMDTTKDVKDGSGKDKDVKKDVKPKDAVVETKDVKPKDVKPKDVVVETKGVDSKQDPKPATNVVAEIPAADVAAPTRARHDTVNNIEPVGRPPEMPPPAPVVVATGTTENPTHMPGPRNVPSGNPDQAAPAPGLVPRGDSRSLRRSGEFALIYRLGNAVITRFGVVGTRGQWRVVEYPTSASASHTYARECSRFISEGFSDYRDETGTKNCD